MPTPDPRPNTHRATRAVLPTLLLTLAFITLAPTAWAQKNSGPLLPVGPAAAPPVRQVPRAPAPMPMTAPTAQPGANPEVNSAARALPLAPDVRETRDAVPADRVGTERRLGLREPRGEVVDMRRGRTPTPREIVDALAPR